jgi:hypothetical protein
MLENVTFTCNCLGSEDDSTVDDVWTKYAQKMNE